MYSCKMFPTWWIGRAIFLIRSVEAVIIWITAPCFQNAPFVVTLEFIGFTTSTTRSTIRVYPCKNSFYLKLVIITETWMLHWFLFDFSSVLYNFNKSRYNSWTEFCTGIRGWAQPYALSFYRSQNILGCSKFFVPY